MAYVVTVSESDALMTSVLVVFAAAAAAAVSDQTDSDLPLVVPRLHAV